AVLPADTLAEGPPSGAAITSANGIMFPRPSQPVEGFSAIVDGRRPGEILAMPDNGYGSKANSADFLIRAYYLRPDFKTATGGTGDIDVGRFIQFSDPRGVIGFPIVREGTADRWLTGADIDPESMQRGRDGDLWVGDEFGPWILHFDSKGRLLDPPFPMPGGLQSPSNPHLGGQPATQPGSRGLEAMAISPNGKFLYAALEGATVADTTVDPLRRYIFEFSVKDETFTGRTWQYHAENSAHLVADMAALDRHHLVLIERDAGRGATALFRNVYEIDLRDVDAAGFVGKELVVDLTKIPDPNLVSLPEIHPGDLGLGDPFSVTCESIEAIHPLGHDRVMLGCDNNLPNTGRNPTIADDNEFIVVDVPGLD
ncbi:MAG TPA: esterase-like activity of phytase family protein, partial [Ilumatobacteraceae bacterium]|nr:esterase-like activity of phytase family protein [Ilumatobacteraceae bacterium]